MGRTHDESIALAEEEQATVLEKEALTPQQVEQIAEIINDKMRKKSPPQSEKQAKQYFTKLQTYISKKEGQFLRGDDGSLHLIIDNYRIELNLEKENHGIAELMLLACSVGTYSQAAKAAIQRLQVKANRDKNILQLQKFSAFDQESGHLFIPAKGGKLLQITEDECQICENRITGSSLVEHPYGDPFDYKEYALNLDDFERLLVDTQACEIPAMHWFVAMHEGLFPFIRDAFPARFIVVHIGPTQQGKTSGAQRFTLLHGLGQVKGDFSVAALNNQGDIGLLVMDNKEQSNFSQELIDYCLFLATGAERGRSYSDGCMRSNQTSRPVGVITSIEGVVKAELKARCVDVRYRISDKSLLRGPLEREIVECRSNILSALMPVLQGYLRIAKEGRETPNPKPHFEEHITALCNLLRAYGEVAQKPGNWSEDIINQWDKYLGQSEDEGAEELEPLIQKLIESESQYFDRHKVEYQGRGGTLYRTLCRKLLTNLRDLRYYDISLPKEAPALGNRLASCRFQAFKYLTERTAPENVTLDSLLRMTGMTGGDRRIMVAVTV